MTRGDQRDRDRQRAANRHAHNRDDKKKEGDFLKRREADAKALAEKVAKKREAESTSSGGGASSTTVTTTVTTGGGVKKK